MQTLVGHLLEKDIGRGDLNAYCMDGWLKTILLSEFKKLRIIYKLLHSPLSLLRWTMLTNY